MTRFDGKLKKALLTTKLAVRDVVTSVPDGMGLNPTLQYPAMAIHPPMLYLGYVGMTIPFAFAMASMLLRQPGEAWIHTTRRWSLVSPAWHVRRVGRRHRHGRGVMIHGY